MKISEILVLLDDIYDFWFPNDKYQEYWFSSEYDYSIKEMFNPILKFFEKLDIKKIYQIIDMDSCNKVKRFISIIVLLDQFSRNIYRKSDFRINDQKTLVIVSKYDYLIDELKINEFVFYCLVFRHNNHGKNHYDYLDHVLGLINIKAKGVSDPLIAKLLNQTVANYGRMANTYQIDQNHIDQNHIDQSHIDCDCVRLDFFDEILDYIDPVSREYFENITEKTSLCEKTIRDYLVKYGLKKITVSLSGGVDSMVIFSVLIKLKNLGIIDNFVCVHVDYGNRDESSHELEFVRRWCMSYHIDLLYISLNHVKRIDGKIYSRFIDSDIIESYPIDRGVYENSTKNIRFDLYKKAHEIYGSEVVFLGHHADDLSENVLMNAFRTGSVLDLFTMKDLSTIYDIQIGRPFLSIPKSEIYYYAHSNKVLYLNDTTTDLCYRGVIRKKVIPILEEIDPKITVMLRLLGSHSDKMGDIMQRLIMDPILKTTIKYKHGFSIDIPKEYYDFESIISRLLVISFHSIGRKMISRKNLKLMINEFKMGKKNIIRLSNGMNVFFEEKIFFIDEIIFTKEWSIDVVRKDYDTISDRIDVEKIMNGHFEMKYMRCCHEIYDGEISVYGGHKESSNRRFFRGNILSKFIPKKHIGHICKSCKEDRITKAGNIERLVFVYQSS